MNASRALLEASYIERTPRSAEIMVRAREVMPGGNTRDWTHHAPYPVVFERASGPYLWDVDGNRYVDAFFNGLSVIHGHHYEPVEAAIFEALRRGAPWHGSSDKQVAFAEMICRRLKFVDRVTFTNSGTEAGMLAVKLARRATGRPLILKAWGAYHGSYADLEIGLPGRARDDSRTLLARFGDPEEFERILAERGHEIACVFIEPVMVTVAMAPPPPGFLQRVQEAARKAGALVILDDCLMLRLAYGGSQQKFDIEPDITFLGKFIGGGLPMGVVGGRAEVMDFLDPRREGFLEHGGSYNGNLAACSAGLVNLEHLTQEKIDRMDAQAALLQQRLVAKARQLDLAFTASREGSLLGVFFADTPPTPPASRTDRDALHLFRLACLNHGVSAGPTCQFATATTVDDEAINALIEGACAALEDVAQILAASPQPEAN